MSPARNFADAAASRMSQGQAIAVPPPMHQPRTAEITGFGCSSIRSIMRMPIVARGRGARGIGLAAALEIGARRRRPVFPSRG